MIERLSMLLDWQNYYCEHGYIIKNKMQIQFNPHYVEYMEYMYMY